MLGIINRDGALAQYLCLPAANLVKVPEGVSDQIAAYAEPLAAACRITEQQVGAPAAARSPHVRGRHAVGLHRLCAVFSQSIPGSCYANRCILDASIPRYWFQLLHDIAICCA